MKTSKVFKLAKRSLWDGKEEIGYKTSYVCLAIDCTKAPFEDKGRAKKIVGELLCPHTTLRNWLFLEKRIITAGKFKKLQATRHAWLDHLIEHYASIGD